MKVEFSYLGRSGLKRQASGTQLLQLAPNLSRDAVGLDAPLIEPVRFREAISALHDVVINDLRFEPRDKAAYEVWKVEQAKRENEIRRQAMQAKREKIATRKREKPSAQLKADHRAALVKYWASRTKLNWRLRRENKELWRKLMPYDPVITVAEDVVFFECFSADESSYGCLTVDREECLGATGNACLGTTNVDYSWDLYESFQKLRSYRETRFNIDPTGFEVATSDREAYREEKIALPDGWLRGFMQLQAAMCLPMRKVSLSVSSVYSLLAFLKRNKAKKSPRAIRFELADGQSPRMVLEPWEREIDSVETTYHGPTDEPIRVWGRRRLLTLGRILPLCTGVDVYLLGTGLPSFWVARMGNMRLTLGLSGWTTNDWTRGSAVQLILPPTSDSPERVASLAQRLSLDRVATLSDLTSASLGTPGQVASALNQLALRGQVIYDLHEDAYRWRQVLPMELSDREMGPPHPELQAAQQLCVAKKYSIRETQTGPRGGTIVSGQVGNQECEALVNGDGVVKRGRCRCSWHYRFGIRNGPCRHLQVLREVTRIGTTASEPSSDWFEEKSKWAGKR